MVFSPTCQVSLLKENLPTFPLVVALAAADFFFVEAIFMHPTFLVSRLCLERRTHHAYDCWNSYFRSPVAVVPFFTWSNQKSHQQIEQRTLQVLYSTIPTSIEFLVVMFCCFCAFAKVILSCREKGGITLFRGYASKRYSLATQMRTHLNSVSCFMSLTKNTNLMIQAYRCCCSGPWAAGEGGHLGIECSY